jgi:predicted MFS family arabinose efflux permease
MTSNSVSNKKTNNSSDVKLNTGLIFLLAVATGVAVANTYYVQPLLHELEITFKSDNIVTSLAVTATQVGYAFGLLLLVPLGDIVSRKKLAGIISSITVLSLLASAVAKSIYIFELSAIIVGLTSVITHILIPFVADMAHPSERGKSVAKVMSGLLSGILLSRGFSGVVAQFFGWRSVYFVAAVFMATIGILLALFLPREKIGHRRKYSNLISSTWQLFFSEPVLRRRAILGATTFGAFSILWTSITFLLTSYPYQYSVGIVGLFSLVGLVGILAANLAGKMVDRGKQKLSTWSAAIELLLAFIILYAGKYSIVAVIFGIIILDAATQSMQITNQGIIFTLNESARSRINSSYMFCYFLGASIGSLLSGYAYQNYGWNGVCTLGLICGLLTVVESIKQQIPKPPHIHNTQVNLN